VNIYVLRHAQAEALEAAVGDSKRPLTLQGRKSVEEVLRSARKAKVAPDVIFTSPLIRAKETAEIAASVLRCSRVVETNHLLPTSAPFALWREISEEKKAGSIFLVGHEPHLSRLIAFLLEAAVSVDLKKGALVRIETRGKLGPPRGVLKWMITPRLARAGS